MSIHDDKPTILRELSHFDGGLVLDGHKDLSTGKPVQPMPAVKQYIVPLQQHIGAISEPLVKVGDRVLKGQMIGRPGDLVSAAVHSPVSGTVTAIEEHAVPHISGLPDLCIFIENDFKDEWVKREPLGDEYNNRSSHQLRNLIRDAGIVGLGGAAFPAAVKQTEMNVHTLILNGVECEPYITCDDMLMREQAEQVLAGADIIGHVIKAQECVIAIEDNKPEAIAAMQAAVERDGTGFFRVQAVPTIYPSGGEKQLIKILTGREVPKGRLPAELNVLVHNVATAHAIHRAVYHDEPLISRIATVTGQGIAQPQNIEVLVGTPVKDCVEFCGGYTPQADELIMGGPMMGFSLPSDDTPLVKASNCLLVMAKDEIHYQQQHMPCIRCGHCVEVCPARLLPQQLYWYASSKNNDRVQEFDLFDCIECGCCAYVCPSDIPLVQYYRAAKTVIRQQERERKASDLARQRHEAHQARLERQKREREERLRKKREMLKDKEKGGEKDSKKAAIAAAIARAQAKKAEARKAQAGATEDKTAETEQEQSQDNTEKPTNP
ncbi:MAG TPA: electron transport complex subunit RsxC [Gammaproteobacteria bacterium]|nr:electron transport complex subunit RsxC [Gammaproteobacteria bacterium]